MDSLLQKISELFHNFTSPIAAVVYSPKNVENAEETKTSANQIPEALSQETGKPETGKPDSKRPSPDTTEPLTSGDIPTPDVKLQKFREQTAPHLNYELEFVNFVDRNAPQGLSKKLMDIMPYLEVSFLSWPAFWIWRGYNWQSARKTERIAFYIQRTYQQAKLMQLAILTTGLFTISMGRPAGIPIEMHTVHNNQEETDDIGDSS
ncbi:uncharacterized protein LOC6736490 [Drosophila simulans]|uniref:Uncharacterized protein n=1 Tax=Drosophila simulans TaxID=7240 RepID=A0A0J9UCX9_DROSI|nr:uncharacterized protein LOC6736490 [Drosophila simulans]KMY97115.1 uncharacterized protein Dsimw501_GD13391 [Drosophila simulans]